MLSPALAVIVYGLSAGTARLPLLVTGAALLIAFAVHALRTRTVAPLLDLRLFTHRPFAAASSSGRSLQGEPVRYFHATTSRVRR